MKGVNILKKVPAVGALGTTMDVVDIAGDIREGNTGKVVLKSALLIAKETIRFSSPIGFGIITAIDIGVAIWDFFD